MKFNYIEDPVERQKARDAFAVLEPYLVEVEYIDSGIFVGGEEELMIAGMIHEHAKTYIICPNAWVDPGYTGETRALGEDEE